MSKWRLIGLALLVALGLASAFLYWERQRPRVSNNDYRWVKVVEGLRRPTYMISDGTKRFFIVEQAGQIRVAEGGNLLPEPFLDLSERVKSDNMEQGLLSMAFDPQYQENAYVYVAYTGQPVGDLYVERYQAASPTRANPDSRQEILHVPQPSSRHNGGLLLFGPDDYLYLGLGDGSLQEDVEGHAQNPATLLGGLLRLDVSGDLPYRIPPDNPFVGQAGFRPELWAYGLRNPWRFSFDRATGDLYIADVGQEAYEEVNFQAAGSAGGQNYGWSFYEGQQRTAFNLADPPPDLVFPIYSYDHSVIREDVLGRVKNCSIIGAYVYRGAALPALAGHYLFGDWCSGNIWTLQRDEQGQWQHRLFMETGLTFSSFAEDDAGELYLIDYGGILWRLEPAF